MKETTDLYGPVCADIWREALVLPGHGSLLESLAFEVGRFFDVAPEEALRRMEDHWAEGRIRASRRFPRNPSPERLKDYYSDDHGVYAGMYWHSLVPDRYALHAVEGLHAVQRFAPGRRVFELGHGVGSAGLLFARHGFDVTLGEISKRARACAEQRFRTRGLGARFLDLTRESPEEGAYDAAVSFDVLEHIPCPLPEIEKLRRCLKPGGLLVLNVAFGRDPGNPEHILSSRRGVLERIRAMGFERLAEPTLLVYRKRECAGFMRRSVNRLQDYWDAWTGDVCGRWPALRPLLRPYRSA